MGRETNIAWCHHSFNCWWGCEKIDPACKHCYAADFDKRTGRNDWGASAPRRFFGDKHWAEPLAWNIAAIRASERRRVFCMSMGDVFEDRPDLVEYRQRLWRLIRVTPQLDWLLLTKRPENLSAMLPWMGSEVTGYALDDPMPNVRLGVTAGTQKGWDERVAILMSIPAAGYFVSCEPLLERIDTEACGLPRWPDQIIVGGESGGKRRPMEIAWMDEIAVAADRHGSKVFIKQDVALYPGQQGRIPAGLWARKECP